MRFFAVTLLSLAAATFLAAQQPAVPDSQTSQSVPTTTAAQPTQSPIPTQPSSEAPSQQPPDQAYDKFEKAAELCPRNVDYITAREFTRQQLVMEALERGNKAMLENKEIVAMGEFRRAAAYDPTNEFAIQRLLDSMPD